MISLIFAPEVNSELLSLTFSVSLILDTGYGNNDEPPPDRKNKTKSFSSRDFNFLSINFAAIRPLSSGIGCPE